MPVTAREAALKVLASHRRRGAWSGEALDLAIEDGGLGRRDAALMSAIVFGVLQNITLLDFYLSSYLSNRINKLEPMVLDILRLSAYQLIFLTRVPAHAAVSEGVKLTKKYSNPRAASLVNAVLRKLSSNTDALPPVPEDDPIKYFSIKYSHPEWLIKELLEVLDYDGTVEYLIADNSTVPITVQINTIKCNPDEAIASLYRDGCAAEKHPWLENALTLPASGNLKRLTAFSKGLIYVQDAAARLAVTASAALPGMTVLDGCAAPGGKSFAAAIEMNNAGKIISCDLHDKKLCRIAEGSERLGISIIETLAADARKPYEGLREAADVVFADVPCSGIGVIRKKPEIRWKDPSEFDALPAIQLDILHGLSRCVKPGGTLIYSTCTVRKSENEDVCLRFLTENKDFAAAPLELSGPAGRQESGMVTLWPHLHGTDGFFICRLIRRK